MDGELKVGRWLLLGKMSSCATMCTRGWSRLSHDLSVGNNEDVANLQREGKEEICRGRGKKRGEKKERERKKERKREKERE